MSRRFVRELAVGDSVNEVFLIAEMQIRSNRQGQSYLHLQLRDRSGAIDARLWNIAEGQVRAFEQGTYVRVEGKVQQFQGANQLILSRIEAVSSEGLDANDYLPEAPRSIAEMTSKLREILYSVQNPHLRALAECFLIDDQFLGDFTTAPAGIRVHHAFQGGLLDHVLTILEAANRIADLYPDLDRDLLLLGIFLHDVGKVRELTYNRGFAYSDEGQLVGHIVLGLELLSQKVNQTIDLIGEPFPDELHLSLKHLIVSHHGSNSLGSPKPPMTPEAIALHCLDTLDSKVHSFQRQIRDDPSPDSSWTTFDPNLGHRIYKGTSDKQTIDE